MDGGFRVTPPADWTTEPDEEGGLLLYAEEGCGLLHLIPFPAEGDEATDPAEELYAFLVDQDIEIEEDEVEDLELAGSASLALCEYLAEEADQMIYWMLGVATAPGRVIFASYSCPAGEEGEEREIVHGILASLEFE